MNWKTYPLVRSKVLGLFGNRFTADRMYPRHTWENLQKQVQTPLCQKQSLCSSIFIAFLESTQTFAHFEKKISFIAYIIRKLLTPTMRLLQCP